MPAQIPGIKPVIVHPTKPYIMELPDSSPSQLLKIIPLILQSQFNPEISGTLLLQPPPPHLILRQHNKGNVGTEYRYWYRALQFLLNPGMKSIRNM